MTHNWENWQKFWAEALVNEKSVETRAKHAAAILKAAEKEAGVPLVGIHSHADLDRIRVLLSNGEEMPKTNLVLSLILFDKDIQSINYNIETINGSVYVIGIAQSQKELDQIINHARTITDVKKVVSHVVLKNDPRRAKTP